MTAIFKREFKSFFTSPLGFIFLAIFFAFEGIFFVYIFGMGSPAVEMVFPPLGYIIFLIVPVITMRLLSEDRRLKVDQALLTAPVKVPSIIFGKFLSALAIYGIGLAPTLIFQIIAALLSDGVNWLVYLNGLLGAALVGTALISIGMFISSLTESTIISCILTYICNLILMMFSVFAPMFSEEITIGNIAWLETAINAVIGFVIGAADKITLLGMLSQFSGSVFHITDVVYLSSIAFVFVFLSIRMVERRRWA